MYMYGLRLYISMVGSNTDAGKAVFPCLVFELNRFLQCFMYT